MHQWVIHLFRALGDLLQCIDAIPEGHSFRLVPMLPVALFKDMAAQRKRLHIDQLV